MKNNTRVLLFLLALLLVSTACFPLRKKDTPITHDPNETRITISENLNEFTKIDIECAGKINLIQGNDHAIEIEGPKSMVEKIKYSVSNSTLKVTLEKSLWQWFTEYSLPVMTISFANLEELDFKGGSQLNLNDLTTDNILIDIEGGAQVLMKNLSAKSLDFSMQGGGDVEISGVADIQKVRVEGGLNYQAGDLESLSVDLNAQGAVNAEIWATTELILKLSGAYNVRYYGDPSIRQEVDGVGSIEGLGDK